MQQAIANYDVNEANAINAIVPYTNQAEYKHQRANELVLKYMNNRFCDYTAQEKQDLYDMASECIIKGDYVIATRNIINLMHSEVINYDDNCELEAFNYRKNKGVLNTATVSNKTNFNLYPNPNNGLMQLDYDLGIETAGICMLMDVTGKIIDTYKLSETKGTINMNEQNLNNGIYFYCILVNNKIVNIK